MIVQSKKAVYKLCLLGEMGVGKTSLWSYFKDETQSIIRYRPSFTADHCSKMVETDEGKVGLIIWDTAGSERFRTVNEAFVRNAACCILIFSLTERTSFSAIVKYWWPQAKEWCPSAVGLLVGNKVDCDEKAVSAEEIKNFCEEEGLLYIQTSALTGENVTECFRFAAQFARRAERKADGDFLDSFQLCESAEEKKVSKKRKCCVVS